MFFKKKIKRIPITKLAIIKYTSYAKKFCIKGREFMKIYVYYVDEGGTLRLYEILDYNQTNIKYLEKNGIPYYHETTEYDYSCEEPKHLIIPTHL